MKFIIWLLLAILAAVIWGGAGAVTVFIIWGLDELSGIIRSRFF